MVLFVSSELKRQFMELLEKDVEFRYAVAGYLGLSEIIKRLDEHDRKFNEILAEIKALREDQKRLWENQNKLWENQNRLWEEIKALIEGQSKLWEEIKNLREGQNKIWEEVKSLREGQSKLWEEVKSLREGQNKLWEETKALREGQSRLWEEVKSLREGQNKLWGEVRGLREVYVRLEGRVTGLEKAVSTLARTIGVTLNDFVASFVEEMLRLSGIPEEKIRVSANVRIAYGETIREVDIFNSDPIVVGQVTTYISSIEEAKNELNKLLEDVRFVEKITGRKVFMAILAIENTPEEVAKFLETECEKLNVKFISGRLIPKIPTY
jgi:predicted nuclease with TOPRIM domain